MTVSARHQIALMRAVAANSHDAEQQQDALGAQAQRDAAPTPENAHVFPENFVAYGVRLL